MPRVAFGVRFAPQPPPPQAPRKRLAAGTAQLDDGEVSSPAGRLPVAPDSRSVTAARYVIVALCLFGVGFIGALALATM